MSPGERGRSLLKVFALRGEGWLGRLHDPIVLLAWAAILTGIMLNAFFGRTCNDTVCQTYTDLVFIFATAVGAGLVLNDERLVVTGFIVAHVFSTILFVIVLAEPVILGIADPFFADTITSLALVIAFSFQFPFALLLSLSGCVLGAYFAAKLKISEE